MTKEVCGGQSPWKGGSSEVNATLQLSKIGVSIRDNPLAQDHPIGLLQEVNNLLADGIQISQINDELAKLSQQD